MAFGSPADEFHAEPQKTTYRCGAVCTWPPPYSKGPAPLPRPSASWPRASRVGKMRRIAPLSPTAVNFESIVSWRADDGVFAAGALDGKICEVPPPPQAAKLTAAPAKARSLT